MKRAFSISIILLLVRASRNSNIMRPTTFDPETLRQYLLRATPCWPTSCTWKLIQLLEDVSNCWMAT